MMEVHLIDGTYELFRHYFGVPKSTDASGQEIGAVRGVLTSIASMLSKGCTHIGVATDHVIESFRNDLYDGYKTGGGIAPDLWSQFPILEQALVDMGVVVWPMVEFEADDALASAAKKAAQDESVERVIICTPDKDLSQCVVGKRVVQLDRRQNLIRDHDGVVAKFGIAPESIPDYLALVGDSADGFPGLSRWGEKAASTVLAAYPHLEDIPLDAKLWPATVRGAKGLLSILQESWEAALLFRTLATLRTDAPVFESVEELRWRGPTPAFERTCERLRAKELFARTTSLFLRTGTD